MDKLIAALQRLYFFNGQQKINLDLTRSLAGETSDVLSLVNAEGKVRTLVVSFKRSADWPQVSALYWSVQDELHLPAPAVSVSGEGGFQLWFSLAQPVAGELVQQFFRALRSKYLAEMPEVDFAFHPGGSLQSSAVNLVPGFQAVTQGWSAFIDPSLGEMFVNAPWLEMSPNLDRQADMLAAYESINPVDFERAIGELEVNNPNAQKTDSALAETAVILHQPNQSPALSHTTLSLGDGYADPRSFLLAVMNDPSAGGSLRVEAAKALLPYCNTVVEK